VSARLAPFQSAVSFAVMSIGRRVHKEARRLLVIVNIRLCRSFDANGCKVNQKYQSMDTIFDHIEPFEDFLTLLARNKVSVGDVKYFPAYREYLHRRFVDKDLYYNCVDELSEKYGLRPGTFRTKIRLFSEEFKK
jgi:hypothetical protein